jgi:hypothetical protein
MFAISVAYIAELLILSVEYTECQAFPQPTHPQASVGSKGGDTLACGEGGVGTQFRRWYRHSGTLGVLYYNPCTILKDVLI